MNRSLISRAVLASLAIVAMCLAIFVQPAPVQANEAGWRGEYFSNPWLVGQPAMVRTDNDINFQWGVAAPAAQLPQDNFSVRWTRSIFFEAGRYRFTIECDDGMRLFVDGQLVIDRWYDQAWSAHSVETTLSAGTHVLRLEYYEHTGFAVARLSWTRVDGLPPQATATWTAEYYSNPWLAGEPTLVREDNVINFDWNTGSPDYRLPIDNFSARWTRSIYLDGGTYRFTTETDDGVRLFIDGQLLIDRWQDQSATTYSVERYLAPGTHAVRLEYYEHFGVALARLSWTRLDQDVTPTGWWYAEFYANPYLVGSPIVVREDQAINFDWGTGSPDARIPADNFSARWTRSIYLDGGRYRFTTETDDGVRLYIDGNLVIDRWYDMSRSHHTAEVSLGAGVHTIRMEYYEHLGLATAILYWNALPSPTVGNLVTCVRPVNSWIKAYRLDGDQWIDVNPRGWGAVSPSGYLKIDGLPVDFARYGWDGNPYRVELWADGVLIRSVGNTDRGEPEFRLRPLSDNPTPWGCPAP